jgi:Barstar (barnase inhibitor)
MKILELDASGWKTPLDFYDGLFAAVEAPWWHGTNLDALIDSMVHGDINAIEPPYKIVVTGTDTMSASAASELAAAILAIGDAGGSKEGIEFHTAPAQAEWVPRSPIRRTPGTERRS